MIASLLVANRGEIACRIFRTARRLGVRSIAVYSDADSTAQHVREADEAVRIGPAAPRDSYLSVDRILEAARRSGAAAIHPGYGFLSENASFAQAVVEAGFVFVGPPAAAIAAMGSKILAKARMRRAGVPVLPGYEAEQQDQASLHAAALALGFPLIIKPAAGGGGKGMRIVTDEKQLGEALDAARRLAQSAFGDGALLLERFLPAPRHVEVQVFADTHGHLVHLGDRDCSIQRRHQKLIEEAPAPRLPEELRLRLRAAALIVAREIGYVSAGTVEFLFDGRELYFMEMNTRLQVEHTVTEAVTGLDLVEWQLRIASGEALPLAQEQIVLNGHAIEARVCAEDPEREFLPSAGTLQLLQWPRGEGIRVDAGFASADQVPADYDSLLGKVIAWAPSRAEAEAKLAAALERTYCAGVHSNEHWLARILRAQAFHDVTHSIAYLQDHLGAFRDSGAADTRAVALAALATREPVNPAAGSAVNPWTENDGFIPNLPATLPLTLSLGARQYAIEIGCGDEAGDSITVQSDPESPTRFVMADVSRTAESISASLDGVRINARYFRQGTRMHIWLGAAHHVFGVEDPRAREFSSAVARGGLTTPLPGVVVSVPVEVGQKVAAGDALMVIEAMKMEHTITAPQAGTVKAIHFARGDRVPQDSELLELTDGKD